MPQSARWCSPPLLVPRPRPHSKRTTSRSTRENVSFGTVVSWIRTSVVEAIENENDASDPPPAARRCLRGEQRSGGTGRGARRGGGEPGPNATLCAGSARGRGNEPSTQLVEAARSRRDGRRRPRQGLSGHSARRSSLATDGAPLGRLAPVRTTPSVGEVDIDLRLSLGLRGALRGASEASMGSCRRVD